MNRIRTIAIAVFSSLLVLFGITLTSGVAQAAPGDYVAPPETVSVSANIVLVGSPVTFSAGGFLAGEAISITVNTVPAAAGLRSQGMMAAKAPALSAVADSAGFFSASVSLTEPGVATITAVGLTSGVTASVQVRVAGSAAELAALLGQTGGSNGGSGSGNNGGSGTDASGAPLASTGAGINVAAMIAIGLGVVLAGFAFTFFGARGAFGSRKNGVSAR